MERKMTHNTCLPPDFGVTLAPDAFEDRFLAFHKQLFASAEFDFPAVTTHVYRPPPGMYQVDHSFWHDGTHWHLYYVTGDMRRTEEWIRRYRAGDMEGANEVCLEPGNGHAVGPTLFDLDFREHVFLPPQGRFDLASRGVCALFEYGGRYGMFYDVRGEAFIGMSLAWSTDLATWELDARNPVFTHPDWADPRGSCKDPHILKLGDTYLIYYVVMDRDGYCCVALASTEDWTTYTDRGCVLRAPPMLRGTMGIESPCVVHRDGIWHLFITYGPGLWHAISPRPGSFTARRGTSAWSVGTGFYYLGPFHATEIVRDPAGEWWLTTDRKEETRRLNRAAGRLCYRGSYADEKTLEEGIYLSHIRWDGDRPVLEKPARAAVALSVAAGRQAAVLPGSPDLW